jgi:hypothetical protein
MLMFCWKANYLLAKMNNLNYEVELRELNLRLFGSGLFVGNIWEKLVFAFVGLL